MPSRSSKPSWRRCSHHLRKDITHSRSPHPRPTQHRPGLLLLRIHLRYLHLHVLFEALHLQHSLLNRWCRRGQGHLGTAARNTIGCEHECLLAAKMDVPQLPRPDPGHMARRGALHDAVFGSIRNALPQLGIQAVVRVFGISVRVGARRSRCAGARLAGSILSIYGWGLPCISGAKAGMPLSN